MLIKPVEAKTFNEEAKTAIDLIRRTNTIDQLEALMKTQVGKAFVNIYKACDVLRYDHLADYIKTYDKAIYLLWVGGEITERHMHMWNGFYSHMRIVGGLE